MNELSQKLRTICQKVNGWGAAIMTPNSDNEVLMCAAHFNLPEDWVALTNPLDDTTLNGLSFTHNRTVIKNHVHAKTIRDAQTRHAVEAIIIAPIKRGSHTLGTLEIIADDITVKFGPAQQMIVEEAAAELADFV